MATPLETLNHHDEARLDQCRKMRSVRVRTVDGSVRVISVGVSYSVLEVTKLACSRIGLPNFEEFSLSLDNRKDGKNPQHKEKILHRKLIWLEPEKTLSEQGVTETTEVTLRQKYFFSDSYLDTSDLVQLNLVYIQSRDAILDGSHPCTIAEAIQLAALLCYIQHGNYDSSKTIPSFTDFLPKEYSHVSNVKHLILGEYKKLVGLNEPEAKLAYIQQCRLLPTYGATFFHVKGRSAGIMFVPRLLGISKDAITVLDPKSKLVLQSWPVEDIHNWACTPNTFSLKLRGKVICGFKTAEGQEISGHFENYLKVAMHHREKKVPAAEPWSEAEALNDLDQHFAMETCVAYERLNETMTSQQLGSVPKSPSGQENPRIQNTSSNDDDVLYDSPIVSMNGTPSDQLGDEGAVYYSSIVSRDTTPTDISTQSSYAGLYYSSIPSRTSVHTEESNDDAINY